MLVDYACGGGALQQPTAEASIAVVDTITPERRSENMRRIRSKDTSPEMAVRRLVFAEGYRYRLHKRGMPGKPDLVFAGKKKVIFVHGCFWHCHKGCPIARIPKSRPEYWTKKLSGNLERDERHIAELRQFGWEVLVVWECEVDQPDLLDRIKQFLG